MILYTVRCKAVGSRDSFCFDGVRYARPEPMSIEQAVKESRLCRREYKLIHGREDWTFTVEEIAE